MEFLTVLITLAFFTLKIPIQETAIFIIHKTIHKVSPFFWRFGMKTIKKVVHQISAPREEETECSEKEKEMEKEQEMEKHTNKIIELVTKSIHERYDPAYESILTISNGHSKKIVVLYLFTILLFIILFSALYNLISRNII